MTDMITVSRKEIEKLLTQLNITHQDIRALLDKAAISQAEPVAWVDLETSQHFNKVSKDFVGTFLYGEDSDYTIPLYTSPPGQSAKIAELEAEVSRLNAIGVVDKKDAERYRWLRHGDNDEKVIQHGPVEPDYHWLPRKERLDEMIDLAMKVTNDK